MVTRTSGVKTIYLVEIDYLDGGSPTFSAFETYFDALTEVRFRENEDSLLDVNRKYSIMNVPYSENAHE